MGTLSSPMAITFVPAIKITTPNAQLTMAREERLLASGLILPMIHSIRNMGIDNIKKMTTKIKVRIKRIIDASKYKNS